MWLAVKEKTVKEKVSIWHKLKIVEVLSEYVNSTSIKCNYEKRKQDKASVLLWDIRILLLYADNYNAHLPGFGPKITVKGLWSVIIKVSSLPTFL